jgi:hypothetical protein
MQLVMILLIQAAAALGPGLHQRPPKLDEGWVFPTASTKAATADCPVMGTASAEFRFSVAQGGTKVVGVSGLGRVGDAADLRKIDAMIGPMQGLTDVTVTCWGHAGAFVRVRGIYNVDGDPRQQEVTFLWRGDGPVRLSDTAIYPSVIR